VALAVDSVEDVLDGAEHGTVPATMIAPGIDGVEGVMKHPDGMIFIHDLDKFLSLDEARQLEEALHHV
jgi:purine-binding chemotaxis protein CheW